MSKTIECISPVDGSVVASRPLATGNEIQSAVAAARKAQAEWRALGVGERAAYCSRAVDAMLAMAGEIIPELAMQMGRPVRYGQGELNGYAERARHMISIAEESLADI